MIPVEHVRLGGRRATVAGITRWVDRGLDAGRLCRVEVRLSSEPKVAVAAADVKLALGRLLREHGLPQVQISVRPIEHPLDDALAEHGVRLLFADAPASSPAAAALPHGPQRWPQRWLAQLRRSAPSQGVPPGSARTAARKAAVTPLSRRQAVDLLREALANAAHDDGASLAGRVVARVDIVVRQAALHAALAPLLAAAGTTGGSTARWLGQALAAHGLRAQPELELRYRHQPPSAGDGTERAGSADLELRLHASRQLEPPPGVTLPTLHSVVHGATAAGDEATWMPNRKAAAASLRLRVVGTLAQDFSRPFELPLPELPARFDRAALDAAGFGRVHGRLLRIASRRQPLMIERNAAGAVVLRVGRLAAGERPMYYHRDSLQPLQGEWALDVHGAALVVNDPSGGQDPVAGDDWSALVIRIDSDPPAGVRSAPGRAGAGNREVRPAALSVTND